MVSLPKAGRAAAVLGSMLLEEDVRIDPADESEFSLRELLAMHDVLGSQVARELVEDYWSNTCQAVVDDLRRVDPANGESYRLAEFCKKYAGQYEQSQCSAYFRSIMPRRCPPPKGLVPAGARMKSESGNGSGAKVAVPFAAAALWAASLPAVATCEGDFHSCRESPFAIISSWKYAVNNLWLAVGVLAPRAAVCNWGALLGIRRAAVALEAFSRQPTVEDFTRSVACAKAALGAFRAWLLAQRPVELCVPTATVGLAFLPQGRSCQVGHSAGASKVQLANGVEMPLLAFGTWQILGAEAYQATLHALRTGYRHIDTAQCYLNEREVGRAIRDSGVPRSEIFLATKLSDVASFRCARATVERQLRDLGMDYVDLYMLHNPFDPESRRMAWRELEALHAEGRIRALGVSNFGLHELQDLLSHARTPPVYVQNKMSVYAVGEQRMTASDSVMAFARKQGIQFFGYGVNNPWPNVLQPMEDPHVLAVAARYGRTTAQVCLRWALQLGAGVLAKSASRKRIEENFRLFDFVLSDADVRLLTSLVTLSESAAQLILPTWVEDTYGIAELDL